MFKLSGQKDHKYTSFKRYRPKDMGMVQLIFLSCQYQTTFNWFLIFNTRGSIQHELLECCGFRTSNLWHYVGKQCTQQGFEYLLEAHCCQLRLRVVRKCRYVGTGGQGSASPHPHILSGQFTLSEPGEVGRLCPYITTRPPPQIFRYSDIPEMHISLALMLLLERS